MKKKILLLLFVIMLIPVKIDAAAISSEYGAIEITGFEITDEEFIISTNVDAKDKNSKYIVELAIYRYENGKLNLVGGSCDFENEFSYGENKIVYIKELIENVETWTYEGGTYAFQAILQDPDSYDWDSGMFAACYAISDYNFKQLKWSDNETLAMSDIDCKNGKHIYSKWEITQASTVFKEGKK